MNIQSQNAFGVPLTLGVKLIPKIIATHESGRGWTERIKGYDMILHSELWLCNLTSLPITFGAPSVQLEDMNTNLKFKNNGKDRAGSMLNAETALLELSSILEFGDKGHSFTNDNDDPCNSGDIIILPKQQNDEIVGK